MAAVFIGGCSEAAGPGHDLQDTAGSAATEAADSAGETGRGENLLPVSFTNLASDAALTQSADETTHIQTNVLDLGAEEAVSYFRILWPDLNVQQYEISGSTDGEIYETLYTSDQAPYFAEDRIALETAAHVRYVRLSGIAASALPIPEVYAENPWTSVENGLSVELVQDAGERTLLVLEGVPEGITASFGGCNYEEVITSITAEVAESVAAEAEQASWTAPAIVQGTIEDKTVTVGYTLSARMETGEWIYDTQDIEVYVPAQDLQGTVLMPEDASGMAERANGVRTDADQSDPTDSSNEAETDDANDVIDTNNTVQMNPRPDVIPAIQEWQGGRGAVILPDEDVDWINSSTLTDSADGRVLYSLVDDDSLGREGYRIDIGCSSTEADCIRVYADTETGLYWGNVTLRQMIVLAEREGTTQAADVAASVELQDTAVPDETTANERNSTEDAGGLSGHTSVSLLRGRIRDYPIGSVRGMMLDVGRNTMSLEQIRQIAQNLSWFKMNELTLHLQDNALLTYSDKTDSVQNARTAYSAYRMQSSMTGENGTSITAADLSYSTEEFKALVTAAAEYHVQIIPEIDTPAHSLALTSANPELGLSGRPDAVDMLDCGNPDALTLVEQVWDEQLSGAFTDVETIQIGGDEYYGLANDFVQYESGLLDHLADSGKTIRMWGSLTALLGDTRISPYLSDAEDAANIQMQLWSTYWADPVTMYRAGFDLINSSSDKLYINCGEATDYLDKETLYNTYDRTAYAMSDGTTETLPSWSPRLLGSSAALWNDLIDNLEIGISEYDMTDRVLDALPVLAEKFWQEDSPRTYETFMAAVESVGVAPDSDPLHQRDDLLCGPDYTVSFEVYLPSTILTESEIGWMGESGETGENEAADGQVLPEMEYEIFRVEADGNTYAFKARQYAGDGGGRVGFSREFYDYAFDYTLPTDTRVQLTVVGEKDVTSLYVDGELVDSLGSSEAYEEHATFLFPMEINPAFCGEVWNVQVE